MMRRPEDAVAFWEYADRIEREHPSEYFRTMLLYRIAETGARASDSAIREHGVDAYRLLQSRYSDMPYAAMAEQDYGNRLVVGAEVPMFSFASIDDASVLHTRESLLGKVYLIDLRATWCGPCVGQLPELHDIYRAYHDRGFEILSISLDANANIVRRFRAEKYPMPWANAFAEGGFSSAAAKLFKATSLPRTLLIDRTGRIIGRDVRGAALRKLLAEQFEIEVGTEQ
ncbi:MAG: TlpA family protein disulfide reductase [bacterium]|nr:TlpA family protein disulfide reductase [Candidatus Kapabacteria bacterium]